MSVRGGNEGLIERVQGLEDQVRQLEQGVGLSSLTFRRVRITDRSGRAKYEIAANVDGLEFYDLVSGGAPLVMPIPGGFGATGAGGRSSIPFSLAGSLVLSTSPAWYVFDAEYWTQAVAVLGTVGLSASTVDVRRNGASIGILTIPAGISTAVIGLGVSASPGDLLTVAVTSPGAGAGNLTVQVALG